MSVVLEHSSTLFVWLIWYNYLELSDFLCPHLSGAHNVLASVHFFFFNNVHVDFHIEYIYNTFINKETFAFLDSEGEFWGEMYAGSDGHGYHGNGSQCISAPWYR